MRKYKIVYADPPWQFNNKNTGGGMKSGASHKYNIMSVEDICSLRVDLIAGDNCVLFMWYVGAMPGAALRVISTWGFKLKTMSGFTWVKTTKNKKLFFGMGFWTRQCSEQCLIAVKGKPKRIVRNMRNVVFTGYDGHNVKPDIFRKKIVELMGDIPRIELFARQRVSGWDAFGDQIEGSIRIEQREEY